MAEIIVPAAPKTVFQALTKSFIQRLWLCDENKVHPQEGGTYYLRWLNGYYAVGEFTTLDAPHKIVMTWHGKNEAPSEVVITLTAVGDETQVTVDHTWVGWQAALENLQYTLQTGLDRRFMRRPMLGIFPQPLTAEIAARLGVPVSKGTHLQGVLETGGAGQAGLQTDDVIVTLAGQPVHDYPSMAVVLQSYSGGDTVEVEYYRGAEKYTVPMTLGKRPEPVVAASFAEVIEQGQVVVATLMQELDDLLKGIPEEVLAQSPEPGQWSANQNLAHLIWAERLYQMGIGQLAMLDEPFDWTDNHPAHITGIVATYRTSAALVQELHRILLETIEMVRVFPESYVQECKPGFAYIAQYILNNGEHMREHFQQIREAVAAVQGVPA